MVYIIAVLLLVVVIALNIKSINANSSEVLVIKGLGKTKYLNNKSTLIWRFFQKVDKVIPLENVPFSIVAKGTTSDGIQVNVTVTGKYRSKADNVEEDPLAANEKVRGAFERVTMSIIAGLDIDSVENIQGIQDKINVEVPGVDILEFSVTNLSEPSGILKELKASKLQDRLTQARLKQQEADHKVKMQQEKDRAEEEKAMFEREKELAALRAIQRNENEKRETAHKAEQEKQNILRQKELDELRATNANEAAKLKVKRDKELEDLKATHANEAAKIKVARDKELASAQKELEDIRSAQAAEAARVKVEREKELANAQKDAALAKAEADSIYNKKMIESKKEILDIEIANTKKQQLLEEEKSKIETAKIKATSDNAAYRQKTEAESLAEAMKIQADAEKYKTDMQIALDLRKGQAEAEILEKKGQVEADILEKKGQAKAKAKKALLEAESSDMVQKAEAYAKYGDTAQKAMVLDKLPEITKNIGSSLKQVDKMNIYSNDGKGAEQVTGQVATMLQQSMDVVESVTGLNLVKNNEDEKGDK